MSRGKLTEADVLGIKADLESLTDRRIAEKYGVTRKVIDGIAAGHFYRDVQPVRAPLPTRFYPGAHSRAGR